MTRRTERPSTPAVRVSGLLCSLVLLVELAGCAARRGPTSRPAFSGPLPSPADLAASTEKQRAVMRSARGTTKLAIAGYEAGPEGPVRRSLRTTQAVVVRAPASFRLETLSVIGVNYAVACDGAEVAVLIPVEKKVLRGSAAAAEIGAATGVFLGPQDVVSLLLGLPPGRLPEPSTARVEAPTLEDRSPPVTDAPEPEPLADFVLVGPDGEGGTVRIGFASAPAGPRAVSYVREAASGEAVLEAGFEDWAPAGSIEAPRRIAIRVQTSEALVTWTDVSVDPPIDGAVFQLATPAGYRERPLVAP